MAQLVRVDRTLLRDRAYDAIKAAVVDGELAPGQTIRDVDLAARLGLSRAPVREALARLADEGLVESKPQSWTRVTPLVVSDVRDAATVVRAMQEVAVRKAVPRVTEAAINLMRDHNARFAEAVRRGDVDEAIAADDSLHDVLVSICGNRAVADTIDRYTPLIRRLERQRFGSLPGLRSISIHERLIEACAARDVATAVSVTTRMWSVLEELAADGRNAADSTTPPTELRVPRRPKGDPSED